MSVGGFLKHQNQTNRPTDTKVFFTSRICQVKVNTIERTFDKLSEFQCVKCLIVHALFSSSNASSFELWKEKKTTQQWGDCVANDILLNQVHVSNGRVYVDKAVSKLNSSVWVPFPLINSRNSAPTLLRKMCPRSVLTNARQDLSFAR